MFYLSRYAKPPLNLSTFLSLSLSLSLARSLHVNIFNLKFFYNSLTLCLFNLENNLTQLGSQSHSLTLPAL